MNGVPLDFELEGEKTAGEIMAQLEALCESSGMTITAVRSGGKEIPESELDAFFAAGIESISDLEIEAISGVEILGMAGEAAKDFAQLSAELQDIPLLLQTGRGRGAMDAITRLSEKMESLTRLLPLLSLGGIPDDALKIEEMNPGEYLASLFPFMEEVAAALEQEDTVTIGDICEYEIAPRLQAVGDFLLAVAEHTSQKS